MKPTLQEATRKRNFTKMRIKGIMANLKNISYSNEVTDIESVNLLKALEILKPIEENWEKQWEFLKVWRQLI